MTPVAFTDNVTGAKIDGSHEVALGRYGSRYWHCRL